MAQAVRRVVTGHDASGKAVVVIDGAAPNARVRKAQGGLVSTLLWVTDETPADISGSADRAEREIGVAPPASGTVFRVVEFPPLAQLGKVDNAAMLRELGLDPSAASARSAFMHRTKSVDYAVVISGRITMLLDDSEIELSAGDTLVQQGTNHAWENRGTEPCRIAFVLVDAVAPPQWGSVG